ncbi:Lrp/AsnC family transcriptional regulator [Candidatus Woesearchaeota archaeon]|nr:Lrp/AsnC family transcriptional regulator [Candidatus Woesearchaeota archaeon]
MLDNISLGIIDALSENARTPILQIAKRLQVSESTIRKRVELLENKGIIKGYSLQIDHEKLGYQNIAFVGVDVQSERFLAIAHQLKNVKEIASVASSTGDHMFMLKIMTKNTDQLCDICEQIKRLDGVTRICPAIIKETLKGTL